MNKIEKIIKLCKELDIDFKQLANNEISIPMICDINNTKLTKKDSVDTSYKDWLNTPDNSVLCDDCYSFSIKVFEHQGEINLMGLIDDYIVTNEE